MAVALFFHTSRIFFDELTKLFDFVWPTAAALWNLRWQVRGYMQTRPQATVEELNNRFVYGSGIHGVNLKRACIDLSWEQQQEELAKFVLLNLVSLYEGWAGGLLSELGTLSQTRVKMLQFPTSLDAKGKRAGVWQAIDELRASESEPLRDEVYPELLKHKKNSKSFLDELLTCFRYFKECRNCLAHNGGVCDTKLETAYNAFSAVASRASLGLKEVPAHSALKANDPVVLHFRGVVGLCDVVLRIAATVDAEMTRSAKAEQVFIRYWRELHGKRVYTLKPKSAAARSSQIKRYISKLDLPKVNATVKIEQFLLDHRLVSR